MKPKPCSLHQVHKIKSVLFFCNHATYFASHRLEIAKYLIRSGSMVYLYCGSKISNEHAVHNQITDENITLLCNKHLAGSVNILSLLSFVFFFFRETSRIKPDIIHCISIKSILIGLLYSSITQEKNMIMALSGLGSIFTTQPHEPVALKIRRKFFYIILRIFVFLSVGVKYIVQNHDDKKFLLKDLNVSEKHIYTIRGSGAKLTDYKSCSVYKKNKKILMASRILENKGVNEYLLAVKNLKKKHPDWEFLFAGSLDEDSPASYKTTQFYELLQRSDCKYLGYVADMNRLLKDVALFVLPSYREGFPKALIEASLAGCAIVTTDVPGCRDAISNGKYGIMVKPRNVNELQAAIAALIVDEAQRNNLAFAAQRYARQNYDINTIIQKHIQIYESFL